MKIAVFHNLPSGGAKRALYNAVKYLYNAGHKICLAVPETANEEYMPLEGFCYEKKVFPIKSSISDAVTFLSGNSFFNPLLLTSKSIRRMAALDRCQREIASFINSRDFDLVFSEQCGASSSPFLLRYLKVPSVFFCQQPRRTHEAVLLRLAQIHDGGHSPGADVKINPKYSDKDLKQLKIEIENAGFADLILCNSFYSRETILKQLGHNASVSYLGIDTDQFRPLNKKRENFVLSVGSISPAKGFDFVISSVGKIDAGIRPKVVIVGNASDQTETNYLVNLAKDNGVKLELRVMITDDELTDLYNRAKVFTYASYLEPFGLTPLEGMACGTPAVGVKEGGIRESVLDGVTGFLTDRNEFEFSQAVEKLLKDDDLWTGMAQKGIDDVNRRWTLDAAGDRLLKHINRLLMKSR